MTKAKTKADAIRDVTASGIISPVDCFVTFVGTNAGWESLTRGAGTGCAHYVAHKLGIRRGKKGIDACDLGYVLRVTMLLEGLGIVHPKDVIVNDVWANHEASHCGIVTKVVPPSKAGVLPTITITHCASNRAKKRLGPTDSDWHTFFGGQGVFYRAPAQVSGSST